MMQMALDMTMSALSVLGWGCLILAVIWVVFAIWTPEDDEDDGQRKEREG